MMQLMVGEALSVLWQEPPSSIECTASCRQETPALDHLPESVAGAAVFDPMPRVGSAVGSNEVQLRCRPMVQEGRCKHPALHLRYHLQVRLNTLPGRPAQYTVPASVNQAVCIATPGFAGINVTCRLYSANELY
jgi:hypothetical protein